MQVEEESQQAPTHPSAGELAARPGAQPQHTPDDRPTVRVLVVSANFGFIERLEAALLESTDVALSTSPHVGAVLEDLDVDVVVVDAYLLQCNARVAEQLRSANTHAKLMLAFEKVSATSLAAIIQFQGRGCVETDISATRFVRAVRAVAHNEVWLPRWMVDCIYVQIAQRASSLQRTAMAVADSPHPTSSPPLTRREQDVLRLVERGLTNKEIGLQLLISPNTVKKHLHSALTKRGLLRRRQLYT